MFSLNRLCLALMVMMLMTGCSTQKKKPKVYTKMNMPKPIALRSDPVSAYHNDEEPILQELLTPLANEAVHQIIKQHPRPNTLYLHRSGHFGHALARRLQTVGYRLTQSVDNKQHVIRYRVRRMAQDGYLLMLIGHDWQINSLYQQHGHAIKLMSRSVTGRQAQSKTPKPKAKHKSKRVVKAVNKTHKHSLKKPIKRTKPFRFNPALVSPLPKSDRLKQAEAAYDAASLVITEGADKRDYQASQQKTLSRDMPDYVLKPVKMPYQPSITIPKPVKPPNPNRRHLKPERQRERGHVLASGHLSKPYDPTIHYAVQVMAGRNSDALDQPSAELESMRLYPSKVRLDNGMSALQIRGIVVYDQAKAIQQQVAYQYPDAFIIEYKK